MGRGVVSAPMRAVRSAVGLLTAVPVRDPAVLDRRAAGRALAWAPLVGLGLGALAGLCVAAGRWAGLPPVVAGALAVGLVALATGGLHLDGLADTADGLGSGRRGAAAREVMKRSDIGPSGVVALCLALLVQSACLGAVPVALVVVAVAAGRTTMIWACRPTQRAAATDGLGALVIGTVPTAVPLLWAVVLAVIPGLVPGEAGEPLWAGAVVVAAAFGASEAVRARADARLGGLTGDVLGACCETAVTVAAVVAVVAAG